MHGIRPRWGDDAINSIVSGATAIKKRPLEALQEHAQKFANFGQKSLKLRISRKNIKQDYRAIFIW